MFEQIPVQVWILLGIAAAIYAPARYIYDYIACSPSRRDITQPPEDLSWRTSGQFARSLTMFGALAFLSVFIFTPAALQFAKSPTFWPILLAAGGGWLLLTVANGFSIGRIEPFAQGFHNTFERQSQPKRFWASMAWNTLLGCTCFWLSFHMFEQAPVLALEDRCYDEKSAFSSQEELLSCNELLQKHSTTEENRARLLSARGSAYFRLRNYRLAKIDYSNAIRLDPGDSSSHYNLGLVEEQLGNRARALAHYSAAIQLGTDNVDAFLNRGLIFLDTGEFDQAVEDFTRAHDLKPSDAFPIANRGITYAWKGDQIRAQQDFEAARALDPSNPVMLRGKALLSMKAGDMQAAVQYLTAALKSEPGSRWALRMRAIAYEQLGNQEKAYEDKDELWRLGKVSNEAGSWPDP